MVKVPEEPMPIYEYQCKTCGEFEVMQKITDRALSRCPTCRGKVTKLISNTSFQLKGSGWYVTDYGRKDSTSKSEGKGSTSEAKAEASSDKPTTSSDKAAASADTKPSKAKEAAAA